MANDPAPDMSALANAQVTLTLEQLQNLQNSVQVARQEAADANAKLEQERLRDPANRVAPLNALARELMVIVRFAVANLPPETTRGWPAKTLFKIADLLPALADYKVDDGDFLNELRAFARECEDYALQRQAIRDAKLAADAAPTNTDGAV